VIYRNNFQLDARGGTRAMDSGGQSCNGKATDDTDGSDVPSCPAAHPQRNDGSAIRIHLPTPLEPETTMVRTCRSIARWLTRAAKWVAILYGGIGRHWQPLASSTTEPPFADAHRLIEMVKYFAMLLKQAELAAAERLMQPRFGQ
jgi:hypothetical protein